MRPKILAAGIASESELDEVDRAVREHLNDPDTPMLPHLLFLAWGRKPAYAVAGPLAALPSVGSLAAQAQTLERQSLDQPSGPDGEGQARG